MKSQNERLLEYLKHHGKITQDDAKNHLAIARLASRINDLRNIGYSINTDKIKVINRFGETCHVAEYRLMGD